jgi:hypothetical protein
VLKLSANCPPGSTDRGIYIDTEDDDDNNSHSGNISPNTINANATLHFCQFRSSSGIAVGKSFPVFKDASGASVSYGVLHDFDGAQPTWVLNKKYVYFNDEDDHNESKYLEKPPSTSSPWIRTGPSHPWFRAIWGEYSSSLPKSAESYGTKGLVLEVLSGDSA